MLIPPYICRPGERLVSGAPYIYDANLLLLYTANERVLALVGTDFASMSTDDAAAALWAARRVLEVGVIGERTLGFILNRAAARTVEALAFARRAEDPDYRRAYG